MIGPKPVLDYSPLASVSRGGRASICIAVAIALWCAVVLLWDDPFHSMGNEKAVRIATAAGVLGMLVALRDISRATLAGSRAGWSPIVGLALNILGLVTSWALLPYI